MQDSEMKPNHSEYNIETDQQVLGNTGPINSFGAHQAPIVTDDGTSLDQNNQILAASQNQKKIDIIYRTGGQHQEPFEQPSLQKIDFYTSRQNTNTNTGESVQHEESIQKSINFMNTVSNYKTESV